MYVTKNLRIKIANVLIIQQTLRSIKNRCSKTDGVIIQWLGFFLINPLNPELNTICYLLALLGAHHFLHVSRIRVKLLTFRLLMS